MVHGSTQAHMLSRFATFFGLLESRGLFSAFFVFHYNDILKRSVDRVLWMSLVLGFSWLCPPHGIQTTRLWQEFCGSCAGSLWTIRISFPQCVWLPYVLFSGLWEDFRLLLFSKLGSSQSWCSVCEGWVSAEAQAAVFFWRWRRPEGRPLWKVTLRERRKDLKAGATMDLSLSPPPVELNAERGPLCVRS